MPKKNKTMNFEEALHRLEELVSQLERAEAPLETALALYEEGVGLAHLCSKQLKTAERRVEILEDKNGRIESRPFLPSDQEGTGREDEAEINFEDNAAEESGHTDEISKSAGEENEEDPEFGSRRSQENLF